MEDDENLGISFARRGFVVDGGEDQEENEKNKSLMLLKRPNTSTTTMSGDSEPFEEEQIKRCPTEAWVDSATSVTHGNISLGFIPSHSYHPSPPPPSVVGSESSCKYRQPSANPRPPTYYTTAKSSNFCTDQNNPSSSHFQPPRSKKRRLIPVASSTCGGGGGGAHQSENRICDQSSNLLSNPQHQCANNNDLSLSDVAKILSDLRPCKVMETKDHLVVFCSQAGSQENDEASTNSKGMIESSSSQQSSSSTSYQTPSTRHQSFRRPRSNKYRLKSIQNQQPSSSSTGILGSVFNWLFK